MDFWAQHKDFILKVLAGFGVFLVALIARGITYGEELEDGIKKNKSLVAKIKRVKIAPTAKITELERQAEALGANVDAIVGDIGFDASRDTLDLDLIERTLGYLRKYRGAPEREIRAAAQEARGAIRAELNGGFGQLRLTVQDDLIGEASEKNIRVEEGLGYATVTQLEADELLKYLLQLEMAARLVRACIDARVDAIDEIRITDKARTQPIPGANPEFLQEYVVSIKFRGAQSAVRTVLNGLETNAPRVPWRELKIDRLDRPADHLRVDLKVVPVAVNAEVPFIPEKAE